MVNLYQLEENTIKNLWTDAFRMIQNSYCNKKLLIIRFYQQSILKTKQFVLALLITFEYSHSIKSLNTFIKRLLNQEKFQQQQIHQNIKTDSLSKCKIIYRNSMITINLIPNYLNIDCARNIVVIFSCLSEFLFFFLFFSSFVRKR